MAHPLSLMCSLPLKDLNFNFLSGFTAAGVVPCGGPKVSPRTSSILQVIFSVYSFEISQDILRNRKLIIGQDSFSNQFLIYLVPFRQY